MKNLNTYIIEQLISEKILISKNTDIQSASFASADLKYTNMHDFKRFVKETFDSNIDSFISGYIDRDYPIYIWHCDNDDDKFNTLDEMIKNHRKYHNVLAEDIKNTNSESITSTNYTCIVNTYKTIKYTEIFLINRKKQHELYFIIQK